MVDRINDETLNEAGKTYLVRDHQLKQVSKRLEEQSENLKTLKEINKTNDLNVEALLAQAKNLLNNKVVDQSVFALKGKDIEYKVPDYDPIEIIDTSSDWDTFQNNIKSYAQRNQVDLTMDPFDTLLTAEQKKEIAERVKKDYAMKQTSCDKYDYTIASICGIICGLVDAFFVGAPGDSKLGSWSDKQTDKAVVKFAEFMTGKKFNDTSTNGVEKTAVVYAIEALEKKYTVHYDQGTGKAAGSIFDMTLSNHHMKSLGHSLSIVGLIFSLIDQFTGFSHFLDNGRLIAHQVPKDKIIPIQGKSPIEKIFNGIVNWFGHIMSDIAGSSTTRTKGAERRGTGVPIPGFELLQLFGKKYDNEKDFKDQRKSLADFSVKVFENGYDFRFGVAQSIPVALNELLIRFLWGLKQRFYHDKPWKDCIPVGSQPELRRMLLVGHGVLCLVDIADAGIRSYLEPTGKLMTFALRTNFVAWNRLAFAGLVEVRAIYTKDAIDIIALDADLEKEWNTLHSQNIF